MRRLCIDATILRSGECQKYTDTRAFHALDGHAQGSWACSHAPACSRCQPRSGPLGTASAVRLGSYGGYDILGY
jgi:hypothetical protein